jgi:two-component system sensor histidine kinase VicK
MPGIEEEEHQSQQLQEEFLSLLSHELRAPLTVIGGYAQMLSRKLARKGLLDEAASADIIKAQASRMSAMVADLVESGRLAEGAGGLNLEETNLGELLESIVARVAREQYRNKDKHIVSLEVEPDLPHLKADARRLDQVVSNLLSNAMRYSPDGGSIYVAVGRGSTCDGITPQPEGEVATNQRSATLKVSVTDEGIGVPPDDRAHLFDRAFRGNGARSVSATGLGLGLYICKLIVEAHEGHIGFTEGPRGRGSTFWFSIPVGS